MMLVKVHWRNAKDSLLPRQLRSDARISSIRVRVPLPELERLLKIKEHLETSPSLKKLLLMLVLFGTSMVIAGAVVTPTMSVMSAVGGLRVGTSFVEQGIILLQHHSYLLQLWVSCFKLQVIQIDEATLREGLPLRKFEHALLSRLGCVFLPYHQSWSQGHYSGDDKVRMLVERNESSNHGKCSANDFCHLSLPKLIQEKKQLKSGDIRDHDMAEKPLPRLLEHPLFLLDG